MGADLSCSEARVPQATGLPPLQDLDVTVIESLPPEVVSEINEMYGGKLLGFISENKSKTVNTNIYAPSTRSCEYLGVAAEDTESLPGAPVVESNMIAAENEVRKSSEEEPPIPAAPASFSMENIMPSSLSQVDCSVLQQLPDELRKDIIELLPYHREPEFVKGASSNAADKQNEFAASELNDLWVGSPPKWVDKFKISNCSMFNCFAEMYQVGSGGRLSSLLQRMMSGIFPPIEVGINGYNDAVSWLCEVFRQYIDLKIATDIEEIYLCICLLRRLTGRSEFFLQVYSIIFRYLQASMGEKYGGTLSVPSI